MTHAEWSDHREHRLEMDQLRCPERRTCVSFNQGDFHLDVNRLAEFVATLYETAGLPVPIVLDRVAAGSFAGWISASGHGVGRVLIDPKTPLTFETARLFAAALAAEVERAENEPDPAEVEALAEVLHEAREHCGGAGEWDRQSARTILARYTLTERKPGGSDG